MVPADAQHTYSVLLHGAPIQNTYTESILGIIAIKRKIMNFFGSYIFRSSPDYSFCVFFFQFVEYTHAVAIQSHDEPPPEFRNGCAYTAMLMLKRMQN